MTGQREFEVLVLHRVPVLLVDSAAEGEALVNLWRLRPADSIVRTELYYVPIGPATLAADIFPAIRYRLKPPDRDFRVVQCSALGVVTLTESGKISEQKEFYVEGRTLYWLEQIGYSGLLEKLDSNPRIGPKF